MLQNTKCEVPSFDHIKKRIQEKSKLNSMVTNRRPDGHKKLDPLISKRTQFERATSQLNSMRNSTSLNESNVFNFGGPATAGDSEQAPKTPSNISHIMVAAADLDAKSSMKSRRGSSGLPFNVHNMLKYSLKGRLSPESVSPHSRTSNRATPRVLDRSLRTSMTMTIRKLEKN